MSQTLPTYSWSQYGIREGAKYLVNAPAANTAIDHYFPMSNPPAVVGFDIEWRPVFRKGQPENPVSLIQISTAEVILLIQVSSMSGVFPVALARLLADPRVAKAGVGIQGDVKKVFKDWDVGPIRNVVELGLLAKSVDNEHWKGRYKDPVGLARLVEYYEHKMLPKGRITRSNWEAIPLSPGQIDYAASDAHAGLKIYERLYQMLLTYPVVATPEMKARPKRSYFSFDLHGGQLFLCDDVTDPCLVHYPALFTDIEVDESTLTSNDCTCSSWNPGRLVSDYSNLITWGPKNPDYDPGPPPPPREPKEKKETKEGGSAESSSQANPKSLIARLDMRRRGDKASFNEASSSTGRPASEHRVEMLDILHRRTGQTTSDQSGQGSSRSIRYDHNRRKRNTNTPGHSVTLGRSNDANPSIS